MANTKRRIKMFNLNLDNHGELLIEEFESITECAKSKNLQMSGISHSLKNKDKWYEGFIQHYKGYWFEYIND